MDIFEEFAPTKQNTPAATGAQPEAEEVLRQLIQAISTANNAEDMLAIANYLESERAQSQAPALHEAIFYLEVMWVDRCTALGLDQPHIMTVLSNMLQNKAPEAKPASSWKVRMVSAYALGLLARPALIPFLRKTWGQEEDAPVRTGIALAVASLFNDTKELLVVYLRAAQARNKETALEALDKLGLTKDAGMDADLAALRGKIAAF